MRKTCSLVFMAIIGVSSTLRGAPETNLPAKAEMPPAAQKNNGPGRFYWRAFSRMTPEERKAMMELQAKDPAEFHRKMRTASEALRKANDARRKQIEALAERCRTGSEEEKKAARAELTKIFKDGYMKRLEDSRQHLKEMEKRMKHLAETLEKKEANADAEINMMVENCIRGIKPPRPARPFPPPPAK